MDTTYSADGLAPHTGAGSKFSDPVRTCAGAERASVPLARLETLWVNTGTLCNLACAGCYIESSPKNDRLAYITAAEATKFFDEIARDGLGTREIGFTGGEPFLNPDIIEMSRDALTRGFEVLILTNAMTPLWLKRTALRELREAGGHRLRLRVSLDHYAREPHEELRGEGSWAPALRGLKWLDENGFRPTIAGRTCWAEDIGTLRAGFQRLFAAEGIGIDAQAPDQVVLFPEMNPTDEVPEISQACWGVLGVDPRDIMCASSRMVVKRRDADRPTVVSCTLLPYEPEFELGETLRAAAAPIRLNHPHCARFCVLGGASCS
ncbi:MAG: radical SAM protein [Alphaproteobacteria bacterium]